MSDDRTLSSIAKNRLVSVDVLRGIAASMVLFHHVPRQADDLSPRIAKYLFLPFEFGYVGVLLFLVLSGYCIHLSTAGRAARGEEMRTNWGEFWVRRFWRLYPTYLAAIVLSVALFYTLGPSLYEPAMQIRFPGWDLVTHLLLAHNLFANFCTSLGNTPFWTLGLEEQLYALYAVYLFLRRRVRAGTVLLIVGFISLSWQVGFRYFLGAHEWTREQPVLGPEPVGLGNWFAWPFGFWLAWVLGALAAEAYRGVIRLPSWCYHYGVVVLAIVLGFALAPGNWWRERLTNELASDGRSLANALTGLSGFAFALASFVLLNRFVRTETAGGFRGAWSGRVAAIGVISYSLYLTHVPILALLGAVFPFPETLAGTLLRMVVYTPICLGVAAGFFWLVERHFLNMSRSAGTWRLAPAWSRLARAGQEGV